METFEKCVRRHREASVQAHIPRHRHSGNCKLRLPLISRQIYIYVHILENVSSLEGDKLDIFRFYFYMQVYFHSECSISFSHESLLGPLV